jgi:predicted permease
MLVVMFAATALVIAASYGVARAVRLHGSGTGTFVQGAFRGNLAFVGLPIIYALPETTLAGGMPLRAAAVIVVAPMMVFYNTAGVVALLLSRHAFGWRMAGPFLKQLATTPPLLATLAGIGFAVMGWRLPLPVDRTFAALGEMALPLGLLGVGGSLVTVKLGAAWRAPLAAALLKTAGSPLLGWLVARWWGLEGVELKTILVFLAAPTAVVSYTVAVELKGDEGLAAGTIVLSTLLSVLSLVVIVGAF